MGSARTIRPKAHRTYALWLRAVLRPRATGGDEKLTLLFTPNAALMAILQDYYAFALVGLAAGIAAELLLRRLPQSPRPAGVPTLRLSGSGRVLSDLLCGPHPDGEYQSVLGDFDPGCPAAPAGRDRLERAGVDGDGIGGGPGGVGG